MGASVMKAEGTAAGPAERLEFVDALRGFALLGVFWANLLIFSGITYMTGAQRDSAFGGPLDSIAYTFERFFIENKFIGLFSLLFGVSFWLFIGRARSRGDAGTGLFYRRIGWLFVIGLAHGWLLWAFDVLRFYALWAVLLPLCALATPRALLGIALACAVAVPAAVSGMQAWLPSSPPGADFDALALAAFSEGSYAEVLKANWLYDWYLTLSVGQIAYQVAVFGRLALGLLVARTIQLGSLQAHRRLLRRLVVAGAAAGVIGNTVFAGGLLSPADGSAPLAFLRRLLTETGHLGFTVAYASGLALLFLSAAWRPAVRVFAPVGRMALTWYLVQTLFGVWLFYGFTGGPSLMGRAGPASLAALAVAGFAVQILLARAWLGRFRFGPAEWLWRTLTYWKVQSFMVRPAPVLAGRETPR
ncbi:MAG TPA: DUF418 domain-containing protein [Candidatus Polarisedimenticolia bacterium]|nr:DUF418 domain-containing protein [Candidatus Polarisedimenticolia bacterium]